MRLAIWLVLTVLPIIGLTQLPNDYEAELEMATLAEQYRLEVTTTTNTLPLPSTTTTTVQGVPSSLFIVDPTIPGQSHAVCAGWWDTAIATGWEPALLPVLDQVMFNESRCQPDAHRSNSTGCSGDYGLLQINWGIWGSKIRELGYTCDDLFVPAVNLIVGRWIVYAEAIKTRHKCGFSPWYMSGNYCK
jgi:hypothetical protein